MSALPAFTIVAVLLVVTPGPDMALVTRNTLRRGRRAALLTAMGILAGVLVWTAASALGLGALLATSSIAFTVVKLAGAAYLVYLGIRTLLALRHPISDSRSREVDASGKGSPFREGLLSNLLNPKIAVLFTSLISQFVSPGPSAAVESLALAGIFFLVGSIWICTFALVASAAAAWLRRPRIKRALDAITGVVFVGLGARLATESR